MPDNPLLHFRYAYVFADGTHKEFEACIDENRMRLLCRDGDFFNQPALYGPAGASLSGVHVT